MVFLSDGVAVEVVAVYVVEVKHPLVVVRINLRCHAREVASGGIRRLKRTREPPIAPALRR